MECVILLRLVGVVNLRLTLNFDMGLYLDNYRPISFKLGLMIETTKLYIFTSVWMALSFPLGRSCMRTRKLQYPFWGGGGGGGAGGGGGMLSISLDEI